MKPFWAPLQSGSPFMTDSLNAGRSAAGCPRGTGKIPFHTQPARKRDGVAASVEPVLQVESPLKQLTQAVHALMRTAEARRGR